MRFRPWTDSHGVSEPWSDSHGVSVPSVPSSLPFVTLRSLRASGRLRYRETSHPREQGPRGLGAWGGLAPTTLVGAFLTFHPWAKGQERSDPHGGKVPAISSNT